MGIPNTGAIRARVERLARANAMLGCARNHGRTRVSMVNVDAGEAPVAWPAPEAPTHCACGAPFTYCHVIYELAPNGPSCAA